jgi:hypothetical protein
VDRLVKSRRCKTLFIGFFDKDYVEVSLPHTDALVVTLAIAKHKIFRILVYGSSIDILYHLAFDHVKISRDKIVLARYHLVGFAREEVLTVNSRSLQKHSRARRLEW